MRWKGPSRRRLLVSSSWHMGLARKSHHVAIEVDHVVTELALEEGPSCGILDVLGTPRIDNVRDEGAVVRYGGVHLIEHGSIFSLVSNRAGGPKAVE
jgi:hypothetical protein